MTKDKAIVLAVSFVLFALGVYAVYMDRGTTRNVLLTLALAGLLTIAARQTIQKMKKRK